MRTPSNRKLTFTRSGLIIQTNTDKRGIASDRNSTFPVLPERRVTGGAMDSRPYMRYLREKYSDIYGL